MTEAILAWSEPSVSFSIMEATVTTSWMVRPSFCTSWRISSVKISSKRRIILLSTLTGSSPI